MFLKLLLIKSKNVLITCDDMTTDLEKPVPLIT